VRNKLSSIAIRATADNVQAAVSENVPQALLTRARTIAAEHKQLTEKLADGFDTRSAKKLGEYSPIVNALGDWDKANEVSSTRKRQQ
jgi:RNase adaptor protein for sRNA GlmZ degradation